MIPVSQKFHDEAVGQIVEPKTACLISFSKGLSGGRQYFKLNYSNLTGKDLLQGSSDDPIQNWDEYQYVDYSDRIVSMEWERAVDFPDQVQSALCDVTFDNHDGFFDPANTVSPIYANNAIDRPLKLYAGYRNSGLIPQFVGMTDAPPTLNDKQKTATYHGIDYLYAIGQQELSDIVAMRNVHTDEVLETIFKQFGLEGLNYRIYGNSVQSEFSGKNLADIHTITYTAHATSSSGSNSITVTCNDTGYSEAFVCVKINNGGSLAGKRLLVSGKVISAFGGSARATLYYLDASGRPVASFLYPNDVAAGENILFGGTVPSGETRAIGLVLYCIHSPVSGSSATFGDLQCEVISSGADPVPTKYEPYTGGIRAPNPSYPQAIESVGESPNLFPGGNVSGIRAVAYNLPESLPAGQYTMTADVTSSDTNNTTSVVIFYREQNSGGGVAGTIYFARKNGSTATVVLSAPAKSVTFYAANSWSGSEGDTFSFKNVQLEKGSVATDYTPYGKYSIPVTVTGKNLVNFPDIIGKQITNRYYDDQSTQFKMTPGETYTVSFIVESSITPFTVSALVGSPSAPIADIPGATLTNQENGYKVITFTCPNTENSYLWLRPVRYNSAQTYYYSVRYVQVEKGSTATSYTPGPVTTNIILDEPLRKIGDYADYIDFKTQRVVRRIRSTVITEQNKNTLVTVSSTTGTYPAAYISKSALGNPTPSYSAIPMLMNRYSANGVANYSFRTTSTTNSVEIFDNRFTNLTTARNLLVGLEILSVPEIAAESPVYLPPIRFLSSGFSAVSIGTNIQPSNFILNLPQYQLPQGTNVIPFLFFDKGTRAGDVFRQLMQAEYGLLWLDENGTIQFRPRTYALPDPVYNFQPYSIVSIKALGSQKIINHVRISSDIREVQEYQEVYYKKDSSQTQTSAESTWAVGPHRTVVISASLNDPCYDIVTPTLGHASSVSWFRAHKEGGVEVLSGITCTGELTTNSYKLSFTNNNDFSVEITELVLWGEPAKIINQLSIDVKDTDSVEKYGDQVLEINNNPFIQSLSQAQTLARYILASRANYNSSIEMEVRGDFSLQIGDVVTIPGEYYGQYMIDSIAVKMSAGSLSTVLSLHYSKSVPAFKLNNSKLNSEALLV